MTIANSTRSTFRFPAILLGGLAVLMLHSVHAYAGDCTWSAQCEAGGACCVNGCQFACIHIGVQQGTSSCAGDQACCMPNGDCQDGVDGLCCDEEGGVSAGPGTTCADFGGQICSAAWGCCNPNHPGDLACPNHNVYTCVTFDEGNPILGESCDPPVDTDGDGVHDLCDPCPNAPADDEDGDGLCDNAATDNCNSTDHNCTGSACANPGQEDCDGDGIGDICDDDIDGDGVFNDDDVCDYTPLTLNVETSGVFMGTVRADLDGDCDVDSADSALLAALLGDSTCDPFNGASSEDELCAPPICASCNSCCFNIFK